ncbi:MAG TPA: 1,4-alpha-glucan branching protein domain-containing protein [Solirubrobacteraceae bacterium]
MSARPGTLAFVLHTHMPYVEGFGTWPFGEEWLWEAVATSYLPLLDVLDRRPGRVTLSVTPVLADQLEAPGALARCEAFLREIRPESHRRDVAGATDVRVATALEHSAAAYAGVADAVAGVGERLLRHGTWTSAATHPVLPLLATDAGIRRQLATGIAGHRARTGGWAGGLWLPECAHAPWLDPLLEEAGVRTTCVELTDVFGEGAPEHLRPLRTAAGPLLVPIDRAVIDLVWGMAGYPSGADYRDTRRLTEHRHQAWAVGGEPYDPARAAARARADAGDFVTRAAERVRDGGLCVCALDTELLGHWWHEGPLWLEAVLERAEDAGLRVVPLDEAAAEAEAVAAPAGGLPVTTWGTPRDLSTWSGPAARGLVWRQRAAELRLARADAPPPRAVRELLAVQASDWAFLLTRELAGEYPVERVEGHLRALDAALAGEVAEPDLHNLAPVLR